MLSINCKGRLLTFDHPKVMGIINITPDSFFTGSRQQVLSAILETTEKMLEEGADIIDIGGQSTRPGSNRISVDEELERVLPAIEGVYKRFPEIILSIDTFYSKVILETVPAGAAIVNDVSAGTIDPRLIPSVASLSVPYVLMHMKGNPQNMQINPTYNNVIQEVFDDLNFKKEKLYSLGIKDVIIDPGFGFGKTIHHNIQLLGELAYFKKMGLPIMVGLSRKSTIYKSLGISANESLNGTTVYNTISLLNGASILRVHDVKEASEAVKLVKLYNETIPIS